MLRINLLIAKAMLARGLNDAAYLYLRRAMAGANSVSREPNGPILRAMNAIRNGGLVR